MIYDILTRTWVDTTGRIERIWDNIRRMQGDLQRMRHLDFTIPVDSSSSSDEEQLTSNFQTKKRGPRQQNFF